MSHWEIDRLKLVQLLRKR